MALAGLLAAAYAAISISAALALAGTAQAVEVAHLRTMGLTRRQAFGLVIVEHGHTIVIGFVAGLAFGILLFGVLVVLAAAAMWRLQRWGWALMILLVAMVGAIVLTLHHRVRVRRQDIGTQVARAPATSIEIVKVRSGQGLGSNI